MGEAAGEEPPVPVPVRALPVRGRVLCHGFIESVTYAPVNQVASFVATVIDHDNVRPGLRTAMAPHRREPANPTGRLHVIWLGRRRIPGIDAGTELRLEGMVTVRGGTPTMFNPRYEILSSQEEQ